MKKYFTIEEARKEMPNVTKILRRLQKLNHAIAELSQIKIEFADEESHANNSAIEIKMAKEFHKLSLEFYETLEALDNIGCWLKDLETGLVDFYAKFEGRDIFLCWKLGEQSISHWHEINSGFDGRQKIAQIF